MAARTAADGQWVRNPARTAADGVGATDRVAGEKKPLEISELDCGRLPTVNGCEELRGQLRTVWVPGSGWKWVGRRSRWRSASLAARRAADGRWVRRIARTAADSRGCKGVAGNGWGEEAAGDQRAWLRGRLRTGNWCGELRGRRLTAWYN